MKKFVLMVFFAAGLFLIGCSNESSIVEPVQKSQKSFIGLPIPSSISTETIYTASSDVNGQTGGTVSINYSYAGGTHGTVKYYGSLNIPAGAFDGTKTIAIDFDDQTTSASYSPSPTTFAQPLILNLTYSGLDLSNINPSTISFVYVESDGSLTSMPNDGVSVNVNMGTISVKNARMPHFSRYAFVGE